MTPSARGWRTRDSPLTPFRFTRGREFFSKNRFLAIFGGFKGVLRLAAQAHGPGEADRIAFREGGGLSLGFYDLDNSVVSGDFRQLKAR